jgi:hypothetical protein
VIIGVLASQRCESLLLPRSDSDLVFGSNSLAELSPPLSFIRQGERGPTFPEPLTVRLSRVASEDITVTLRSSSRGLAVENVVIPAGSDRAEVEAAGATASATAYTVTASLDGEELTAEVRVLGLAEMPRLAGLEPAEATVSTEDELEMTVRLEFPAPADGVVVLLSVDGGGEVPASVTVPGDEMAASFAFTAGAAEATAEVTAELGDDAFTSVITVIEGPLVGLVINEVDYDNPSTDTTEFVELYNAGRSPFNLDGLIFVSINGSDSAEFRRVELSGTLGLGEFLVLGNAAVRADVPEGVRFIELPANTLQNGDPDGLAIFDTVAETMVDALCYEGSIVAAEIDGIAGTFPLFDGSPTDVEDPGAGSIIRFPDGAETGDDSTNWFLTPLVTPGRANELGEP